MDTAVSPAEAAVGAPDPMVTRPCKVRRNRKELSDTFTMELVPEDGGAFPFRPGQFNMLYVFGIGEVPISISGDPGDPSVLVHTTRSVGRVTEAMALVHGTNGGQKRRVRQALAEQRAGDTIGVRGPFGSHWPVEAAQGEDVVFIVGGIGLAPLRPAIYRVLAERGKYGNVVIFYGARTPEDILYRKELQTWRSRFDVDVRVTVDRATGRWNGRVGVVTDLVKGGGFDRFHAVAFVCGPEIMMRYAVQTLQDRGVGSDRIYVSMERNMKCAVGFCGHCQFGPTFVCRDGPVYRFDGIEDIFTIWEL
jgi:NAD(P)H-flavin reductase